MIASRLAWELANGPIPDGMSVCHRCDNPPCVNDRHLFLGSNQVNVRDREAKERNKLPTPRTGETHHNAKLNTEQVRLIRLAASVGLTHEFIAWIFDISRSQVGRIVSGRHWKHI